MRIGSHNALSYSGLKNWWLYPLYFVGKCQSKTIEEQYEKYGVRLFDIRINSRLDDVIESAHGFLRFKKDVEDALAYINGKGNCYVRVLMEQNYKKSKQDERDAIFIKKCKMLEEKYPNIKFCNGRRKYDWKVLYDFKYSEPNMIELYSSVTSLFKSDSKILRVLDDWWPWLYARLRNKKNLNKWLCFKEKINPYIVPNKADDYILIDYVNIR